MDLCLPDAEVAPELKNNWTLCVKKEMQWGRVSSDARVRAPEEPALVADARSIVWQWARAVSHTLEWWSNLDFPAFLDVATKQLSNHQPFALILNAVSIQSPFEVPLYVGVFSSFVTNSINT